MSTARRVVMHQPGEPEVMRLETLELPPPGAGEVRIRQTAIGFNYIDVYQRQGKYPLPLPSGLGHEACGVVEQLGAGVEGLRPGDRVAYINAGIGAYADARNVPAERLVAVPAGIGDEQAAAVLFKGLTAQYLLRKTHRVQPG
ncbi:MAG: alcohol dehydrogenase catalytic domain-containing protein, partial [Betaproteobacteria bacterium]|nr:alcohol dehydrogenase catalytic domain-containing protein [Betaproteobacteria bacterium]